jgi:hypothetical protein
MGWTCLHSFEGYNLQELRGHAAIIRSFSFCTAFRIRVMCFFFIGHPLLVELLDL